MKKIERIEEGVKELADEKYREFQLKLCPGVDNILGVRVPVLRNYAKDLLKKYSIDEILYSLNDKYYENIMLQGMVIGLNKNKDIDEVLEYVKKFIPKINNWAICDTFCAGLKITIKNKEKVWNFLKEYLKSNKEFELRFAVVMILDFYVEEKYIDDILKIIDNIKSEAYYTQMAVAWLLSVCIVKFYDKTLEYLKNSKIDKFTFNKAIQKSIESYRITDEQKQTLKKNLLLLPVLILP